MGLEEFDYALPEDRIAQAPTVPRSASRMLTIQGDHIEDKRFEDILDIVQQGDVIVINETKVAKCRLCCKKKTGSKAEITIEKQIGARSVLAMFRGKNPKPGDEIICDTAKAKLVEKQNDSWIIRFNRKVTEQFLEQHAILPTPPYIKQEVKDEEYQTTYARVKGSLAAPTAGLHFTPDLMEKIEKKGVQFAKICLHVSFATFSNIRDDDYTRHRMDREWVSVSQEAAERINDRKGRLFVIGTTAMKSLETVAKKEGTIQAFEGWSDLFIYPGYTFKVHPYGFITNFHLPKSTLLLLVCAYYGKGRIFQAYKHAIENGYRFYSLGDCTLLLENSQPQ